MGEKLEHIFQCHNHAEEKKVKLFVIEFTDYALNWWDQVMVERKRNHEKSIDN